MEIKSTRDLRAFLAETMVMVREGQVDHQAANSISKLCAQVNNSLAIEVKAAVSAGIDLSASSEIVPPTTQTLTFEKPAKQAERVDLSPSEDDFPVDPLEGLPNDREVWCDQCDGLVKVGDAKECKSKFCKAGVP